MNDTTNLTLIDGEFSPADAKEILMSIFGSKIQFHQMRSFSAQERFGKQDEVAKGRISKLKKTIEDINKIMAQAEAENKQLSISSEIKITLVNQ